MRISELATESGVPVHTLKYYLREGLLMPGLAQSRTRADYGPEHLDRVRLVRALVEHGGVGIAGVHRIVEALDSPPPSPHEVLGVAHGALVGATEEDAPEPDADVREFVARLGWGVEDCQPIVQLLADAVLRARAAGIPLPDEDLERYALAMRAAAEVDLEVAGRARSTEEAMRIVVLGTVLVDPVLLALRRLAQTAESAARI
ncbi:MerR family transcriptional regulator [Oryzobacter telluris]|uniref:MerR family transcriptional regulator n=1 Tax=Oryzobacter telluris TaxID=3149179 RepID=UPI00370D0E28